MVKSVLTYESEIIHRDERIKVIGENITVTKKNNVNTTLREDLNRNTSRPTHHL